MTSLLSPPQPPSSRLPWYTIDAATRGGFDAAEEAEAREAAPASGLGGAVESLFGGIKRQVEEQFALLGDEAPEAEAAAGADADAPPRYIEVATGGLLEDADAADPDASRMQTPRLSMAEHTHAAITADPTSRLPPPGANVRMVLIGVPLETRGIVPDGACCCWCCCSCCCCYSCCCYSY